MRNPHQRGAMCSKPSRSVGNYSDDCLRPIVESRQPRLTWLMRFSPWGVLVICSCSWASGTAVSALFLRDEAAICKRLVPARWHSGRGSTAAESRWDKQPPAPSIDRSGDPEPGERPRETQSPQKSREGWIGTDPVWVNLTQPGSPGTRRETKRDE